jgi:anti-sigma B factor antagonist
MTSLHPISPEGPALPNPVAENDAAQRDGQLDGVPRLRSGPLLETLGVQLGAHAILNLAGEIDLSSAHLLREAVAHCLTQQPDTLSLDVSALTFCDVCGLGALRWALSQAKAGNVEFRIVAAHAWMRRLLTLARADDLLAATPDPVYPALED